MKTPRLVILSLLLSVCLHGWAQEAAPIESSVLFNKPLPANKDDLYHLDTTIGYRKPLNGDFDWLMPATLSFGKMLDEHNSLDAVLGCGVIELKPGGTADAQAHQPFFVELGIAWQHYFARPDATLRPYVTANASLLWMTWEYRTPVNSKNYGLITRDYLRGADGFAGLGLRARLRKNLNFFAEMDIGGVGFLPTTYSGNHNTLFANFGYTGIRGGLSLTF